MVNCGPWSVSSGADWCASTRKALITPTARKSGRPAMWASTADRARDNTPARSSNPVRNSGVPTNRSALNNSRSARSTRCTARTVGRAASRRSRVRRAAANGPAAGIVPAETHLAARAPAAGRSGAVGADRREADILVHRGQHKQRAGQRGQECPLHRLQPTPTSRQFPVCLAPCNPVHSRQTVSPCEFQPAAGRRDERKTKHL